jgi:uncharacterized protein (DUF736 family)
MADFERNPDDIGALWSRSSPRGEYLSGTLKIDGREIKVVCFRNDRKSSDKAPDWRILKSTPRGDQ